MHTPIVFLTAALTLGLPVDDEPPELELVWSELVPRHHGMLGAEQVVGSTLVLVHDGVVLRTAHYGLADRDTGRAVDDDTIWHWASITKTLTTIAVLQLRDRGRLALDQPIVGYLPEVRHVHSDFGPIEAITLQHLITHTSGFRATTFPWGGTEKWMPYEPADWSSVAAMMPYTQILFEPGTQYSYSNPGFSMLGRVVEILSGDDIEIYITKNVFMPLALTRSHFDITPYHLAGHRSNNYLIADGKVVAQGLELDTGATAGNGGWNAPIADMVRYLGFLTGDVEGENVRSVLSRASLEETWKPVRATSPDEDPDTHVGMGCFVIDHGSARYIGHTGTQKGFRSFVYWDPQTHTAAIFAANTRNPDIARADSVRTQIRRELFEQVFPLFVD